jgi:hypothetical protein
MRERTHTYSLQSCVLKKEEIWFLKICFSSKMNKISQIFYCKCQTWQMAFAWGLHNHIENQPQSSKNTHRVKIPHFTLSLVRMALLCGGPTGSTGQRENHWQRWIQFSGSRLKLKSEFSLLMITKSQTQWFELTWPVNSRRIRYGILAWNTQVFNTNQYFWAPGIIASHHFMTKLVLGVTRVSIYVLENEFMSRWRCVLRYSLAL